MSTLWMETFISIIVYIINDQTFGFKYNENLWRSKAPLDRNKNFYFMDKHTVVFKRT